MAYQWLKSVFARLLAQNCALCRAPAGDYALCPDCLQELPYNQPACSRCAIGMPQPGVCGACLQRPRPFTAAIAPLRWQPPVDYLLHLFKYQHHLEIGVVLGELLADQVLQQDIELPELLLPTPLHPRRLRSRGFNQALELSRVVAARLELPLAVQVLRRNRPTISQTGLSPRERRRNIRGSFAVADDQAALIAGRHLAVLDDVLTTGSTAAEMSRTLLRAGAARVDIWAIARSL